MIKCDLTVQTKVPLTDTGYVSDTHTRTQRFFIFRFLKTIKILKYSIKDSISCKIPRQQKLTKIVVFRDGQRLIKKKKFTVVKMD